MRILLIEDDFLLGDGIRKGLEQENYDIDWLTDGIQGEQALETTPFDACILDLNLPRRNGLEILKNIRQKKVDTKIMILTVQDRPEECIVGLDSGADDYMSKPFNLKELAARLRALQRRNNNIKNNIMTIKNFSIDLNAHTVALNKQILNIPHKEYIILEKLILNRGRIVSREQLMQTLYGWTDHIDSNIIEVHIHNLRKKTGNDLIRTIRGSGYIIDQSPDLLDS
jgi:two-component system response regulator QseB